MGRKPSQCESRQETCLRTDTAAWAWTTCLNLTVKALQCNHNCQSTYPGGLIEGGGALRLAGRHISSLCGQGHSAQRAVLLARPAADDQK